jgi:DNA-directed RNA polymerase sigma subunit (sigma70/sigma32)
MKGAEWPKYLKVGEFRCQEAMVALSARERTVLALRLGLDGGPKLSLSEVAAVIGVSPERTRQIQNMAFRRIDGYRQPS